MISPLVTVGLVTFNGSATLSRAIDSLLAQSFSNFCIHISDDASTDVTPAICERYRARDQRIKFTKQGQNIGVFANFRFVLKSANTPFFMWAAQDDYYEQEYIAANLTALEANSQCVMSVSQVNFEDRGAFVSRASGTSPLTATTRENIIRYLDSGPDDSSRYYGLFRTAALQKSFPDVPSCYAMDHLVCALSLVHGQHFEVPQVLLHRQIPDPFKYVRSVNRFEKATLYRILPGLTLSRYLWNELPPEYHSAILFPLIKMNLFHHIEYVSYHSTIGRLFWSIIRSARLLKLARSIYRRKVPSNLC
jgi:glycosyltransferase involved in cell wall biosynthesis